MHWEKKGLIFCPNNKHDWMLTHASNPVAELIDGDYFRIYFNCRDRYNRASIGYVDIDIYSPDKIINISKKPILSHGIRGSFDDSGVSMGCIVKDANTRYLYYVGWNLGVTVPFRNSIGLAISHGPSNEFIKISNVPIIDRSNIDPFNLSYPWVMQDDGIWKMWYGSTLKWCKEHSDMVHLIKYAESKDGINWERNGLIVLDLNAPSEYAMSKPCVIKDKHIYRMWYCYRGKSYRIGYAESTDGKKWIRKDEHAGIEVSLAGWDAESISYPYVFDHKGQRFMLYNGNQYGKTGFGLAKLVC
ncbi:MAG: hypothetical protein K0R49_446 [Burkholderiales bacterium]|jgi:hypothetical protein|nr:hypothetical protein [Burkholderiales bacterium]